MALCGCSSGLLATALLALLLLPAQYYVPELAPPAPAPPPPALARLLASAPPADLLATLLLLLLAAAVYLCEWIQRKLLEKRILKLNRRLGASVERLRAWDAQQEQLEATLKLVQNATSEYNLLLYLLLRQHRCIATACPPHDCFFDKGLEEASFLSPAADA